MATGDVSDMLGRIKAVLPTAWFPDETPVLDAILSGPAAAWAWLFSLLRYVITQARITTATGSFLDGASSDFFGTRLPRLLNESDTQFRARIKNELLRPRATRAAMVAALVDLTGRAPVIFEPANPSDAGGYSVGSVGYGAAGGYGSLMLPFQSFITAHRPSGGGIANVAGYYTGSGWSGGGYGVGAIEYASTGMIAGAVTDEQIFATVAAVAPIASPCWTRITN